MSKVPFADTTSTSCMAKAEPNEITESRVNAEEFYAGKFEIEKPTNERHSPPPPQKTYKMAASFTKKTA
jgi:hypothetical protein